MAERIRHPSSKEPFGGTHQGCMQGLLHFLDFNQRLHMRKMLAYKRNSNGKHPWRIKFPKNKHGASSACNEDEHIDRGANILIVDKDNVTESSGKSSVSTPGSERSWKQDPNKNISPLVSRLLRTVSMHRLEYHDYADNMISDAENITIEHGSHKSGFSEGREHIPLLPETSDGPSFENECDRHGTLNAIHCVGQTLFDDPGNQFSKNQSLLRETVNEVKEVLSKKKDIHASNLESDAASNHPKELLDAIQVIDGNRDILLKILQDPSFIATHLRSQQTSSDRVLNQSGSFRQACLSGRRNDELPGLEHKPKQSGSPSLDNQNGDIQTGALCNIIEDHTLSVEPMRGDDGFVKSEQATTYSATSSSCSDISSTQREIWTDDRSASNHFKVIKKRIKDVIRDNRKEAHRISRDRILHKIPYGRKLSTDVKKEKHSSWGSPASERYIKGESKHKSIKKSYSLTESLDKYSRLLESISSKDFRRLPETSELIPEEDGDLQNKELPKTFGRICSLPEFESYSSMKDEIFDASPSLEISSTGHEVDSDDCKELKTVASLAHIEEDEDTFAKTTVFTSETINVNQEWLVFVDDQEKSYAYRTLEDVTTEDGSYIHMHEQEIGKNLDENDEPTKQSQILDSSAMSDVSEGSDMKATHIPFGYADSLTDSQSHLDVDASYAFEGSEAEYGLEVPIDDNLDSFHVQVDQKDEDQFNYVREILRKSGIAGDLSGTWYSPYHPVDPLLFEEAECSSHELDVAGDEPDISLQHQVLFDLINEVLWEIYEASFACNPWLSRFDHRIRPIPAGHHVLEEVWSNISWYLSSQPEFDPTLDYVVARDFAKNDGWMELRYDFEDVGLELEDLIVNDLLDEVIVQMGEITGSQFVLP